MAQSIVEGQRYQVGDAVYVGQGGRLVLEGSPQSTAITTRPGDPTLPTRQAILAEQLRHARMQNRELSNRLGPEQPTAQSNLTGADYLATLPPADQRMVRSLMEGRIQIPTGRALTQGNWPRWIEQAQQVDPGLDAANARTRYMTRREYTSGVASRNVIALNTALGHIDSLAEAADALDNGTWPLVNRARNVVREGTGDPRINNFNLRRQAVADELEKVFRGTGGSLEGVRGWQERINAAQSPEQLHGALEGAADLLNSRLHAVADSYDRAMGRSDAHMDWLSPHAADTMSRYGFTEWGSGGAAGASDGSPPPPGPTGSTVNIEGTVATRSPGMDRTVTPAITPDEGQARQLNSGTDLQIDPVLRTVGRHLGNMIASGRPNAEILDYASRAGADPNNGNLRDVLRWRRGERVPGFNGSFQQWRAQNPRSSYPLGERFYTRDVPQSAVRSITSSVAESPYGSGAVAAGNALLGNRLDDIVGLTGGNAEQARAGLQALRDQNPMSSLVGDIAGTAAAYEGGGALLGRLGGTAAARFVPSAIRNLGTAGRARLGDAAYGLYSGSGDDYGDAPLATALNVGGGMFGRSLARGGGRALAGSRDAATRLLTARNVPLTVGQISGQGGRIGQTVRGIEDRLSGLPIIGGPIQGQHRLGLEGFNRAAFNESVTPIGGKSAGDLLGEDALGNIRVQRSNAYDNALSGQSFTADPQFVTDMGAAVSRGASIPTLGDQFRHIVDTRVGPMFDPTGVMTGRDFQAATRGLRSARTEFIHQPLGHDFGQAIGDAEGALTGMVQRQAPGVLPSLNAANQTNRMVSILGDAVRGGQAAVEGGNPVFTPFRLNQASIANTTKYGGRDAAISVNRPFFDLTRAGQQVLPNKVPDSGTAGRLMLPLATTTLLGGGGAASDASGYSSSGLETGLALSAALAMPYSNAGRKALQTALVRRPQWSRDAGEFILTHPQFARRLGMFAAPVPGHYGVEGGY